MVRLHCITSIKLVDSGGRSLGGGTDVVAGELLADNPGTQLTGAVVSEVAVDIGQTQAVLLLAPRRLILEPDEVPHGLQTSHPDVASLPPHVGARGPPVLTSQQGQLHLDEI